MKRFFLLLAIVAGIAMPVEAQRKNPYAAAIRVNDRVITNFEIEQRILLLRAFGTGGDLRKQAEEGLIDDRLRLQAAAAAGLAITAEDIDAGVDEFAQRGGLNGEQLYQYVRQRGADVESLKDFVRAGLLWRTLVQARFGPRAAVSETEIDTALNLSAGRDAQEVLIAEIRLPLNGQNDEATLELAKRLSNTISGEGAFAAAARRYSRAPSRGRSGRLDWVPVGSLPPQLAGQIMALNPGEVSAPVPLGQSVGLFQFRGVRPAQNREGEGPLTLTYLTVNVPGDIESGRSDAVELINDVDTCDDMRAQSKRFGVSPPFTEHADEQGALSQTIALELAQLDRNEASFFTNSAGGVTVIMLCSRLRELPEGARDNIRNALFNQRITGFGDGYLQELKGDAVILYLE